MYIGNGTRAFVSTLASALFWSIAAVIHERAPRWAGLPTSFVFMTIFLILATVSSICALYFLRQVQWDRINRVAERWDKKRREEFKRFEKEWFS